MPAALLQPLSGEALKACGDGKPFVQVPLAASLKLVAPPTLAEARKSRIQKTDTPLKLW